MKSWRRLLKGQVRLGLTDQPLGMRRPLRRAPASEPIGDGPGGIKMRRRCDSCQRNNAADVAYHDGVDRRLTPDGGDGGTQPSRKVCGVQSARCPVVVSRGVDEDVAHGWFLLPDDRGQ